jgi:hypothetical protein
MDGNSIEEECAMSKIKDFLIGIVCLVLLLIFFVVVNGGIVGFLHNIATSFFFFLVLISIVAISWLWSKIKK